MNRLVLTYSLLAVTFCCLWFFGVFVPYHRDSNEAAAQVAEAESQIADFRNTISELPRFIEKQRNLLSLKNDMNSKLYTKKDVLKLFGKLRDEAFKQNVTVTEITPPIEELLYLNTIIPDSGQPQFLNIGLKLEGDYIGFGKFVDVIEHANYFRGVNVCKMYGHSDDMTKITLHFGFKALLGNLREEV